jgi:hypothetical protein
MMLLVMQSSPFPYCIFPLRAKYLTQHPILELPLPLFFSQCQRPSLTPIQNSKHNDSVVYFNVYIFPWQTGRQKILHSLDSVCSHFLH